MLIDIKTADSCWWVCSMKDCRVSCFALFCAKHHDSPIFSAGLCSHRAIQMVWLCPSSLSSEVGRWWGKVCVWFKWLIPSDPQASAVVQSSEECNMCFTQLFFFSIILSPPLAPWSWEGCRGADVAPLLALIWKTSWKVKSRARWEGISWLQQKYSRHLSDFCWKKIQFSTSVEITD